ncbi:alpha/beta hydrolase [Polaribacter marinaquae]|uniref:Alpha/beta hydrolase n=1 Tax=Polaribacter marinaquae TaxID=1642819 RepID=A0ABZ2TQZ6_9FLAO
MKIFRKVFFIIFFSAFVVSGQEKSNFKPYTVTTTFKKLKKKYPFITPIKPIFSNNIISEENVVYKKVDKTKLMLDIYYPSENKNTSFPAVLLIHGGGWLTGSRDNQQIMAQHLALKGYVAITVSYRLGLEAKYPAAVNDIKDAIVWLKQKANKYHINKDKIAVLGASAGAQLATLVGVTADNVLYTTDKKTSNKIQAIVNIDGIVSFIHPEAAESKKGKASMAGIWLDGEKEENYKNWKEASPLEYVGKNTPPILFVNSSYDRFHAGRDDMISILNRHKIYNQTFMLPKSPHSFWLVNPWFKEILHYVVCFLDNTLK